MGDYHARRPGMLSILVTHLAMIKVSYRIALEIIKKHCLSVLKRYLFGVK